MYDILALEITDEVVKMSVDVVMNGTSEVTPNPEGNFRLFTNGGSNMIKHGNGGENSNVVVVIGHANSNEFVQYSSWDALCSDFSNASWGNAASIFLVACSTADEGEKFVYGNMAQEAATKLNKSVWASSGLVYANDLNGTWKKIEPCRTFKASAH